MKKVTKYSLVAGTTLGLVAMLGVANLSAVNASPKITKQSNLVQKISEKFSLNQDEVNKVFEEERIARHNERLTKLVADGKITEEQKTLMENHFKEMETKRNDILNSDKTEEEKKQALNDLIEEGRKFIEDNDIPKPDMKGNHKRGYDKSRGFGPDMME